MLAALPRYLYRIPGLPEVVGPLARQVGQTTWLPRAVRDAVTSACATNLALPGYVRHFSTRVGGTDITMGARPKASLIGLAYYKGLEAFEPNTVAVFAALAPGARTIVDVGANVGIFSLLAARLAPAARILAFEPQPIAAMSLARNVGLSEAGNVEVLPTALGAEVGYAPLFTTVSDVLTSLDESRVPDAVKLIVPVTTLDAVVVERKVEGVDLIKVDAEGWELPVLRGTSATLARDRPTIIFEALADSPAAELASFFEGLRYEIFVVAERRLEKVALASVAGHALERNFVAVAAERRARLLDTAIAWPA